MLIELLKLAGIFFRIGLFTVGGGMAIVPMIQKDMVAFGYMTIEESIDVIAISQMTPGPFAVNAATFVGMRLFSVPGAVAATVGMILPSILITLVVARFFFGINKHPVVQSVLYGVRPVVLGLIAWAGITVAVAAFFGSGASAGLSADLSAFRLDLPVILIAAVLTAAMLKTKVSPILYTLGAGVLGAIILR
ncbi:chromate transporter [Oscillospiraceae bacterium OttesenSCG-928-F05]|nr:chromate transporter [Oscillospiraceae bacterium OttesenSCG-928-F05]